MNVEPKTLRERLDGQTAANLEKLRDDLAAALDPDDASAAAPEQPAPQPQPASVTAVEKHSAELENFLATGERLLTQQRRRILTLESDYEIGRTKLLDGFRVRMADLEHEATEALRSYDADHAKVMTAAKRLEDALTAMRG